jgi:hypothetical protein
MDVCNGKLVYSWVWTNRPRVKPLSWDVLVRSFDEDGSGYRALWTE